MKSLVSFMKKEYLEAARTGKIVILLFLFVLFGIMSPAIAKLTPWMMKTLSDSMAESGFIVTNVQVDALTSWTQFFKNIPIVLIAFVLIFSDIFTKEYKSGTLLLILTKGLSRYKVVLAKAVLLLSLWTVGYGICFAITYGYNAYFWDNSIMNNLVFSVTIWWLFGVWVICLIVLFSSLGIFIEYLTESKGLFTHSINEYQLAFDGYGRNRRIYKSYYYHCFLMYNMRCYKYSDCKQEAALSMSIKSTK